MNREEKEMHMRRALLLARNGWKGVFTNPLAGCVIVNGKTVVGEGYHAVYGEKHAEIAALEQAGEKARRATLFVSLEPCNHFGKTPPCTRAIVAAGIKKVVCAVRDPHHAAKGGKEELEARKISVETGILEAEARELNKDFFCLTETGKPFVTLKLALTRDECISWGTGEKKRITGTRADAMVQELRGKNTAILVGINTVLKDDPRLTCRIPGCRNPVRVILDAQLKLPLNSALLSEEGQTIVFCAPQADRGKEKRLGSKAVVIRVPANRGKLELAAVLDELGKWGLKSLLVEGGGNVAASFVEQKLVQELVLFLSPKTAGKNGLKAFGSRHAAIMRTLALRNVFMEKCGADCMMQGSVV